MLALKVLKIKRSRLSFTSLSGEAELILMSLTPLNLIQGPRPKRMEPTKFLLSSQQKMMTTMKLKLTLNVSDYGWWGAYDWLWDMVELSENPVADSNPVWCWINSECASLACECGQRSTLVFLGLDVTTGQAVLDSDGIGGDHVMVKHCLGEIMGMERLMRFLVEWRCCFPSETS